MRIICGTSIEIFEEYGWDWTYHAFREWNGWSLEHEGTPGNIRPSANNDRREVIGERISAES